MTIAREAKRQMLNGSELRGSCCSRQHTASMQQLSFGRQLSSPSDALGTTSKHRSQPAERRKRSQSSIFESTIFALSLSARRLFPRDPRHLTSKGDALGRSSPSEKAAQRCQSFETAPNHGHPSESLAFAEFSVWNDIE